MNEAIKIAIRAKEEAARANDSLRALPYESITLELSNGLIDLQRFADYADNAARKAISVHHKAMDSYNSLKMEVNQCT